MDLWVFSAITGAIAGGLGVLILGLALSFFIKRNCPDCGQRLPYIRKPANLRQTLWGGSTCPHCGCEIDQSGRKIKNS